MASAVRTRSLVVCGVDIGSTNVKVVGVDDSGMVVRRAHRPTPRSSSDASIDAEQLFDVIEDMIIEVCGAEFAMCAVSVAGVGEDGILVDPGMRPLSRALPWFHPARLEILRELRPRLEDHAGLPVATDAARTLVGWAWARFTVGTGAAVRWLALTDYAASRWSHRPFMSDTLAARTGAWLPSSRTWIPSRVDATLGDMSLLPPVEPTGELLGTLSSPRLESAGVLGLNPMVVAGGHDHPIGGWGVNQTHPGAILDSMGTAEVVVAQSSNRDLARTAVFDVAPGIRSQGTTLLAVNELSRNVEWASQDQAVATAIKDILAGTAAADEYVHSDAFLPGGPGGAEPRFNHAPSAPLSQASAVLGALARTGAESVRAIADHLPEAPVVFAAGGWARSPGWIQIKATTGTPLRIVSEPEVTAVGAALLAAHAVGWQDNSSRALALV